MTITTWYYYDCMHERVLMMTIMCANKLLMHLQGWDVLWISIIRGTDGYNTGQIFDIPWLPWFNQRQQGSSKRMWQWWPTWNSGRANNQPINRWPCKLFVTSVDNDKLSRYYFIFPIFTVIVVFQVFKSFRFSDFAIHIVSLRLSCSQFNG